VDRSRSSGSAEERLVLARFLPREEQFFTHFREAAENAAETAAVIEVASRLGIPVSTTHVISSAIMGAGKTRRASAVRWGVAGRIVTARVVTIPGCVATGWACYAILHLITGTD
jgi:phosphate/sulfate permease